MSDEPHFEVGSGNVFADLDYPDPEEALLKAKLAREVGVAIQERGLSQEKAGELLGLDQPKVSAITRGRLSGFSVERLLRCLVALERDVTITVAPKKRERGQIELVSSGSR
jgi:predicted XRE-type DNA-binding protein